MENVELEDILPEKQKGGQLLFPKKIDCAALISDLEDGMDERDEF